MAKKDRPLETKNGCVPVVISRREFLGRLRRTSAALACGRAAAAFGAGVRNSLQRTKEAPIAIPENFTGLGYEISSVATPGILSIENRRYVELLKGLGRRGVIRVGGIVANYSRYAADGAAAWERQNTVINRAALETFNAFLAKVGWTAIWSVNFAQGSAEDAIGEARAVAEVLGERLLALEIGNEVDTYGKGQPFRSSNYDYAAYLEEFCTWHAQIAKVLPKLRFAAPDTASAVDWVERMAEDAKGEVQLFTTHYYRNPQRRGSADQLLRPDPRLSDIATRMRAVAESTGVPWRMCEINSFSGGGRPGVSDTFAGALWTLNTMLLLARDGCAGVNMETGMNQLGFVSSYSPIQDDGKGMNSAGVPYYGMLAFSTAFAGCNQVLPVELSAASDTVTACAFALDGKLRSFVIVNTDADSDALVETAKLGLHNAFILRLEAPSQDSSSGVTFGGATVDPSGRWMAKCMERAHNLAIQVPRMSAAVVTESFNPRRGQEIDAGGAPIGRCD
jgi:hypothetical protein